MAPSVSIEQYYAGKTIFITGATGFMGKVLVEKLLWSCPDLKKMYLLMRPKKGHGSKERLDDLLAVKLFDRLKAEHPKRFEKLQVIAGDVLSEDLGISQEDRRLITEECQIIFHCAACVRFDMFLRDAVKMNTIGTKKVLLLAEAVKNLESFVHVSTSYCRCELDLLEEKVYPSKHRPEHVMHCVNWMDDELLSHMQPKMIAPQPNTYAYTKSLTEDLVSQYAGKFPIVIARPSIVTAAYKEPLPGWVDNLNGPTGLLVGGAKGVVRTMHCNENYHADVVPVDMAVNACIILGYLTGIEQSKEISVCNITLSENNPLTWGEAIAWGRVHVKEYPFSVCLWYPGGSIRSSWVAHQLALFFTHMLPAYFVDLLMFLMGKKTFLVKIQKRVSYGLEVLQYYTTKEWHFKNDNLLALPKKVSKRDDEIFYTDTKLIDWSTYMRNYMKGAREYCLKEDPATLPQAKKLHVQYTSAYPFGEYRLMLLAIANNVYFVHRLYYLDKVMQILLGLLLSYFVYYYFKVIFSVVNA